MRLRWTALTLGIMTTAAAAATAPVIRPASTAALISSVQATGRPVNVDPLTIVERLMSFDIDLDDRLTADELPERMQAVFKRADKDKDGYLTKDEIRRGGRVATSSRGIVRSRPEPDAGLSGVISDLKLSREKHQRALGIVRAHESSRGSHIASNPELYASMSDLLDDEEHENFVAAAERSIRVVMVHELRAAPPPPPPPQSPR